MNTARTKVERAKAALLEVDPYDYQALGEAQAAIKDAEERVESLEEEWLEVAEQLEG